MQYTCSVRNVSNVGKLYYGCVDNNNGDNMTPCNLLPVQMS